MQLNNRVYPLNDRDDYILQYNIAQSLSFAQITLDMIALFKQGSSVFTQYPLKQFCGVNRFARINLTNSRSFRESPEVIILQITRSDNENGLRTHRTSSLLTSHRTEVQNV